MTGAKPKQRPIVLIVEDDDDLRSLIVDIVVEAGCEVVEAADGRTALALVSERRFDAIFLDPLIPELDGYDFREEQLKLPNAAKTPLVVVTAVAETSRIAALRATAVVRKPFAVNELAATLRTVIRAGEAGGPSDYIR